MQFSTIVENVLSERWGRTPESVAFAIGATTHKPDRYIYCENASKNRPGGLKQLRSEHKVVTITAVGGNRCPVFLLDTYISKLPTQAKEMDLFYCHPRPPVPNSALEP